MHDCDEFDAIADEYVPWLHRLHDDLPSRSLYSPGGHAVHVVVFNELVNVPTGHCWQVDADFIMENFPVSQSKQEDDEVF